MDDSPQGHFDRRFELAATVLLATAAVATAWASYQLTRSRVRRRPPAPRR